MCIWFFHKILNFISNIKKKSEISKTILFKIIKGFAITSGLLGVFHIICLLWSFRNGAQLAASSDNHGEVSDNFLTRVVLFISIVLTTTFSIFFILYKFAPEDLINHFAPTHEAKALQKYQAYIAEKENWIDFLSITNIIFGIYTIFCSFINGNS